MLLLGARYLGLNVVTEGYSKARQLKVMPYLCLLIIADCNLPVQPQLSRILILQRVNEVREGWRHKVSAAGWGTADFKGKSFFVLFCLL